MSTSYLLFAVISGAIIGIAVATVIHGWPWGDLRREHNDAAERVAASIERGGRMVSLRPGETLTPIGFTPEQEARIREIASEVSRFSVFGAAAGLRGFEPDLPPVSKSPPHNGGSLE